MPFIRAETTLRRVLHYWLAPNAVSPSLGQAKLELVLHSDFCTMDNCSGSFHAVSAGRRSDTSLDACGPRVLCCGHAPSLSQEVRIRFRNGTDSASMGVRTD